MPRCDVDTGGRRHARRPGRDRIRARFVLAARGRRVPGRQLARRAAARAPSRACATWSSASGARVSSGAGTRTAGSTCRRASRRSWLRSSAPRPTRWRWPTPRPSTSSSCSRARCGCGPGRSVILSEEENFPTDLYVAQGLSSLLGGASLRLVPRARLDEALDASVAVLMLTHVDFRTGALHDMPEWTRSGAPRRRARALGPRAQRGRSARGPRGMRGRPRRGLRLQVPERRAGRARVRLRRPPPPRRVRDAASRLDGPRRAVRLRPALSARARHRAPAVRHAPDPEPGRARVRGRDDRAGGCRPPPPQVDGTHRPLRPPGRAGVPWIRPGARLAPRGRAPRQPGGPAPSRGLRDRAGA